MATFYFLDYFLCISLWPCMETGMNGIDSESSSSFTHDKCVWTPSTCCVLHSSLLCRPVKDICLWHFTSRSISLHVQICHDLLHAGRAVLWMAGWFRGHCACFFLERFWTIFIDFYYYWTSNTALKTFRYVSTCHWTTQWAWWDTTVSMALKNSNIIQNEWKLMRISY